MTTGRWHTSLTFLRTLFAGARTRPPHCRTRQLAVAPSLLKVCQCTPARLSTRASAPWRIVAATVEVVRVRSKGGSEVPRATPRPRTAAASSGGRPAMVLTVRCPQSLPGSAHRACAATCVSHCVLPPRARSKSPLRPCARPRTRLASPRRTHLALRRRDLHGERHVSCAAVAARAGLAPSGASHR